MTTGNDDKRRAGDPDDLPPSGGEARAQRKATSMPLVWLMVGLVLVAAFVAVVRTGGGLFAAHGSGAPPVKTAPAA